MTWIRTIGPAAAEGDLKALFDSIGASRNGVADVHLAQSLHPRALRAHFDLYRSIVLSTRPLSRVMRERIGVLVSAHNRCRYCVAHHVEALRQLGDALADVIGAGQIPDALSANERALLSWARRVGSSPETCSRQDADALRALGVSDEELLDAGLTAAYFSFVNRIVLCLGVEVEDGFESLCGDDPPPR